MIMGYVESLRSKIGHCPLILIGSNIILTDRSGRILMQQRDTGSWGLPGGQMEYGESLEQTAIRELYEETGLVVAPDCLVQMHTFSGGSYEFLLSNGDQISAVTTLFYAEEYEGELRINSHETRALEFFDPLGLPEDTEPEYQTYIKYYLDSILK